MVTKRKTGCGCAAKKKSPKNVGKYTLTQKEIDDGYNIYSTQQDARIARSTGTPFASVGNPKMDKTKWTAETLNGVDNINSRRLAAIDKYAEDHPEDPYARYKAFKMGRDIMPIATTGLHKDEDPWTMSKTIGVYGKRKPVTKKKCASKRK